MYTNRMFGTAKYVYVLFIEASLFQGVLNKGFHIHVYRNTGAFVNTGIQVAKQLNRQCCATVKTVECEKFGPLLITDMICCTTENHECPQAGGHSLHCGAMGLSVM